MGYLAAIGIRAFFIDLPRAQALGGHGHHRAGEIIRVIQREGYLTVLGTLGDHLNIQHTVYISIIQTRGDAKIRDASLGFSQQRDRAKYAAKIPHILVFKIAAVAVTKDDKL